MRPVVGPLHDGDERAAAAHDAAPPARFGLHWFGRELLRYPGIWRDVLLAALFIQLIALLVPLLTQVVIDKVITHRTLNTLSVVAVALAIATVFSAALAWIRQHLVLHTGTRIDSVLGAQVFEHLLRLPARYFEHRTTGVLVARLHGIETIRDFLAGAALTLLIDLPFMLLFAAIMFYYSPTLTAIALCVLVLLTALSAGFTPALRRRIDRQFLSGASHQAFLTEYVAGIETVKSLQLEGRLQQRFGALFADYLGAGLAAVAGLLLAPVTFIHPNMGFVALKAFPAAVLGGITSLPGALAGGLFLGVAEALAGLLLPEGVKDVVPYVLLMLALLLFPGGFAAGLRADGR